MIHRSPPGARAPHQRKAVMDVDFGATAADYAQHRAGFPPELVGRLVAVGVVGRGDQVLDIGTGTGTLARQLALAGLRVVGADPAGPLLGAARALDADAGVGTPYAAAVAEALPLRSGTADAVVAGQCWHWFDRPAAAREVRRVLRPGGRLAICHFDWLPVPGNVVDLTERLVLAHNPSWAGAGGTGMHPAWAADVAGAGFVGIETFSFDVSVPYSVEAWRGRVRASAGVGGSLAPEGVRTFDRELADALAALGEDTLAVPHRVWALWCRAPGASPEDAADDSPA